MTQSLSEATIDWKALHLLSDGDKEFEQHLLHLFLEDAQLHLTQLAAALTEKNLEAIRKAAHHLKGAGANVGAMPLSQLASGLEQEALHGVLVQSPQLLEQLEQEFAQIQQLVVG